MSVVWYDKNVYDAIMDLTIKTDKLPEYAQQVLNSELYIDLFYVILFSSLLIISIYFLYKCVKGYNQLEQRNQDNSGHLILIFVWSFSVIGFIISTSYNSINYITVKTNPRNFLVEYVVSQKTLYDQTVDNNNKINNTNKGK